MALDELYEEAQQAGETASEREPTPQSWGFECYGDAAGGIGGGVGGFVWFTTRAELMDFAGRLLPHFNPGPVSMDRALVARHASGVVDRVRARETTMDDGLVELNAVLRHFSQLRWWGQYQELLNGNRAFERKIRAWSRDMNGGDAESDTSPIGASEVASFRESLQEWGV